MTIMLFLTEQPKQEQMATTEIASNQIVIVYRFCLKNTEHKTTTVTPVARSGIFPIDFGTAVKTLLQNLKI